MDDEEETEFTRADIWMQSMVPSLPRGFAIFCLVCNIIVPGLGTFNGALISCCYGRPRLQFRPARYRCPTAFLVMLIGVAQLVCTLFFLVGWLWSIIWGFLMLNLSDPKFRNLPVLPPLLNEQMGKPPIVKVDAPDENVPTGKKNFGRLISKARENKEQALGLVPPPPPPNDSDSSFGSSLLSHISVIRCSDSRTDDAVKSSKIRSESRQNLLENSEQKSVKMIGALRPVLSAHKMFHRWKRVVVSKVPKRGIACVPAVPSNVGNNSNKKSAPQVSLAVPAPVSGRKNSIVSAISVTPATPVRSRPSSAIGSKTTAIVPPENIATLNPVVVHVAQSKAQSVTSPSESQVRVVGSGNKSEWKVEKMAPVTGSFEASANKKPGQNVEPNKMSPSVNVAKAAAPKVDPISRTGQKEKMGPSVNVGDSATKGNPASKTGSKVEQNKSEANEITGPTMETSKVVAKVGPLSARSAPGLTLNPTELFQRQQMKPRMKQSITYHYDV